MKKKKIEVPPELDRIKSFYAQVFSGSLEQITTQSHTEDTHEKSFSVGPSVLKGQKSGETSSSEQIEQVAVPGDLLHIDVLSKLREMGYLQSGLDNVRVGNLVNLEDISRGCPKNLNFEK